MIENHEQAALLVRIKTVQKMTSFSRSRIYELMSPPGGFPRPLKIGASSLWVAAEVKAFVEKCIAENR